MLVRRIKFSPQDIVNTRIKYKNKQYKTRLYEIIYCSHYLLARYQVDNVYHKYVCKINLELQCIRSLALKQQAVFGLLKVIKDLESVTGDHNRVQKLQLFCSVLRLRYKICDCPKIAKNSEKEILIGIFLSMISMMEVYSIKIGYVLDLFDYVNNRVNILKIFNLVQDIANLPTHTASYLLSKNLENNILTMKIFNKKYTLCGFGVLSTFRV